MEKNSKYIERYKVMLVLIISVLLLASCGLNPKNVEIESENTESTEPTIKETESATEKITDYYSDRDYSTPESFNFKMGGVNYGETITIDYFSTTTGTMKRSQVILPYGYDGTKKYPVLYLLHGVGANYAAWEPGMNAKYIIQNLNYFKKATEMIVVSPNVFTFGEKPEAMATPSEVIRGYDLFINDLVNDLMPYINKNYATLQGRDNTAIAGLSISGREALYIGFFHQEIFGYIGAFSPEGGVVYTGNPKTTLPPLLTDFSIKPGVGDFRMILIAVGSFDEVCGYASYEYDKLLNEKSIKHILYELPVGHDIVVWRSGLYNFARRIFK